METFLRITDVAHQLLAARIERGDMVVDATAGNGHDTLFLAEKVGDEGTVHAYDIQEQALTNTEQRLDEHGLTHRVVFHLQSHTEIARLEEPIQAAVFNLGYLPGSDKQIITQPDSTCEAVEAARSLLREGGIIVIVIYPGHEGGAEEAEAVEQYAKKLPPSQYVVLKYAYINREGAPYIVAIEKKPRVRDSR